MIIGFNSLFVLIGILIVRIPFLLKRESISPEDDAQTTSWPLLINALASENIYELIPPKLICVVISSTFIIPLVSRFPVIPLINYLSYLIPESYLTTALTG